MSLTVISPQHSLVRFDGELAGFIMPAYRSISVSFQFLVAAIDQIALADTILVQIANTSNVTIFTHASLTATNIAAWGRLTNISDADFPITIATGALTGTYDTSADLFAAITEEYGLTINAFDFLQYMICFPVSLPVVSFNYTNHASVNKTSVINFYKGLQQVSIVESSVSLFASIPAITDCFRYVILSGTLKAFSNDFKKVTNNRFLTACLYSNNEDAYGFKFSDSTLYNFVWLPIRVDKPQYTEHRKVYRKSDKSYKLQSSSIEKEYNCQTDYLPEQVHEKIVVMLGLDNVRFDTQSMTGSVTKKDDYNIAWSDEDYTDQTTAKATFKILKKFTGRNSNCEKRNICPAFVVTPVPGCVAVGIPAGISMPDAEVGDAYSFGFDLTGDAPFTISSIVKPSWMTIAVTGSHIAFTGTPDVEGTGVVVSFAANNCTTNTADFIDSINVNAAAPPVTGVYFANATPLPGDASESHEIANLVGIAGSTVTIKLTSIVNTNGGTIEVNGSTAVLNETWDVVLDGSGNGSLLVSLIGDPGNTGTNMHAIFTIITASVGTIDTPNTYHIIKAF